MVLVGAFALVAFACTTADEDPAGPPRSTTTTAPRAEPDAAPVAAARWAAPLSGASNEDEIDGIAAAPDGSVFLTGKFERSVTLGGERLVSAGAADIPLARFDETGEPTWVQRFGGPGEDNLFAIAADDAGAVATGIFEGTVAFGDHELTSAGSWDCVVLAVGHDGTVEWARSLGGPGPDGCNEVVIGADGTVVTSIDTAGGWTSPAGALPATATRDTVLLTFERDGSTRWARAVGGPGPQRGKAIAVGPDGSIAFGGDTVGDLQVDGETLAAPGRRGDAWFGLWSADGTHRWTRVWGGPEPDLVKGLAHETGGIYAVGAFGSVVDLAGVRLDAGPEPDVAVARFDPDGELDWATSVRADGALGGAEVVTAPGGGVLFAGPAAAGLRFGAADGTSTEVDARAGGTAHLVHYRPDGSVAWVTTIAGTAVANPDEITRAGDRLYLDVVIRGDGNGLPGQPLVATGKDGAVWALDLAPPPP